MNAQRALWTFLSYSLIAPFLGALTIVAIVIFAGAFGLGDLLPANLPPVGTIALSAFVWSAMPATLTGIALAAVVVSRGGFNWIIAGAVGVLAFAVAAALFPLSGLEPLRPYFAFLAGLVAAALREMLGRASILAA
jgi:hypothetical protein